jgi:hypothetical protein
MDSMKYFGIFLQEQYRDYPCLSEIHLGNGPALLSTLLMAGSNSTLRRSTFQASEAMVSVLPLWRKAFGTSLPETHNRQ